MSSLLATAPASGLPPLGRAVQEGPDGDASNNDDFSTAQELASGDLLEGTTGFGDAHGTDIFVLKNVPAGKILNASVRIEDLSDQALELSAWNGLHESALVSSNSAASPVVREWEALGLVCVRTGDYYIRIKPVAGTSSIDYVLHAQFADAEDITSKIGSGGAFGTTIQGIVSSVKWYPGKWYRFQMTGDNNGMNDYLYANLTVPGSTEKRLMADLYVRNLEPETFTYWLNHSWWLDSYAQYEEVHAAACYPGTRWYYVDVQAYDSEDRSENYELRLTKVLIESDGDNHPRVATQVDLEAGQPGKTSTGFVMRGPDMFDWYKTYLSVGERLNASLSLTQKSTSMFRLSVLRDNITSPRPEKGYDLVATGTNREPGLLRNNIKVNTSPVLQEGWYYIGVIAQIGLVPQNINWEADWTVTTAWAKYSLELRKSLPRYPPVVRNQNISLVMDEDTINSELKLNGSAGVFSDEDFAMPWGDELSFTHTTDPNLEVEVADTASDPESTVTLTPARDWSGPAEVSFTATDKYGFSATASVNVSVRPVNDPPRQTSPIPDFTVTEGEVNTTMQDINLSLLFTDPDLPPFGDDRLDFTAGASEFPAAVCGTLLSFGRAPVFPDDSVHELRVNVTASDRGGLSVAQRVNITVEAVPPPPDQPPRFNESRARLEMMEDTEGRFDLGELFFDPEGGRLDYIVVRAPGETMTASIEAQTLLVLRPAPDFVSQGELLTVQATDAGLYTVSGQLTVRIVNVNDPPRILPGGLIPSNLTPSEVDEGNSITFRVTASDIDNKSSDLRYAWSLDGEVKTMLGTPSYTWTPGFEDAGAHELNVSISDGLASTGASWQVLVKDVNRPPRILDLGPQNHTQVKAGDALDFSARAFDPDGETLAFTWRFGDGTLIRVDLAVTNSSFQLVMSDVGNFTVVLVVEDRRSASDRAFVDIEVLPNGTLPNNTVEPKPTSVAGTGILPLLLVMTVVVGAATALFLGYIWRRRNQGRAGPR